MTAASPSPRSLDLAWLVRLRWGAVAGQLVTLLVASTWLELPFLALAGILALEAASNVVLHRQAVRASAERLVGPVLALDIVLLTILLHLTGGSSNPFNFLYLVYIALGAVVVTPRWTWGLVLLSSSCFGVLFALERDGHARHMDMELHLRGMWVAFAVAAAFIAYFVRRVVQDLARRESELARVRKIASLGTLAAGAAHELATPLSTIAVIAKELERSLERREDAAGTEDARLIRDQVQRCREILDQMAVDAGENAGESLRPIPLAEVVQAAIRDRDRVHVELPSTLADRAVRLPSRAVTRSLRALINNALDGSTDVVRILGREQQDRIVLEVVDRGPGIPPETLERIGEPFFTTKAPGQGMGLGVFLARAVAESLGGSLDITSSSRGTSARLSFRAARNLP